MKKIIVLMMLTLSIRATALSQMEKTTQPFEIPASYFTKVFTINLGKENKMIVSLKEGDDLDRIKNADSLVQIFMADMALLRDSFTNESLSRRIDYQIDMLGRKKIRLQSFPPKGASFLVSGADLSALKLGQDTVNFIITLSDAGAVNPARRYDGGHYYQISFIINSWTDLSAYADGKLMQKVSAIPRSSRERWIKKGDHWEVLNGDPDIWAAAPTGYTAYTAGPAYGGGTYIHPRIFVNIQNYKNYFVPSLTAGVSIVMNDKFVRKDFGLYLEGHYLFAKDADGKMQTYRNRFITVSYTQSNPQNGYRQADILLLPSFSVSYLISRKGDFFDKNTFRASLGQVSLLNGKIKIEPLLYYGDASKHTTPGMRLSIGF